MPRTAREIRDTGRLLELRPAPGDLHLVQDFVNTADLQAKTDELSSPESLAGWLTFRGLAPAGYEAGGDDFERAVAFRESLRSLLAAGDQAPPELGAALDQMTGTAVLRLRFTAGGELRLEPVADGLDGVIGRLLATLAAAQRDGLWPRFKICTSSTCRAAYYDYSSNRSSLWCLPRCGGRIRARDLRRRRRRAGLRI